MARLREHDPAVVGVVVSGYAEDPVLARFEDAGFAAALAKPFDVASLGRVLQRVLPAAAFVERTGAGEGETDARAGQ